MLHTKSRADTSFPVCLGRSMSSASLGQNRISASTLGPALSTGLAIGGGLLPDFDLEPSTSSGHSMALSPYH